MSKFQIVLGCAYAAGLYACAPASTQDAPVNDRGEEVSDPGRLTGAEASEYADNLVYLYGLTKPNVPVQLNYADPRQYNLIMARLKLTGKTIENSPYLFEILEAQRQIHIAKKLRPGTFAPALEPQTLTQSADIHSMHLIEQNGLKKTTSTQAAVSSTANSTRLGGDNYARLDVGTTTTGGAAVTSVVVKEQFTNPNGNIGANMVVSAAGTVSVSSAKRYVTSSFAVEELPNGAVSSSFVKTEFGSANPMVVASIPGFSGITVTAPLATILPPNDLISLCMDRSWTNDCDYIMPTGTSWAIKAPLAGSVSVTTNHTFDPVWYNDVKTGVIPAPGQLRFVLTNVGGGCDVTDGNTLLSDMRFFWLRTTLSADNKTLSWDLTGANSAYFDEGCRQVQNEAKLTATIPYRVITVPPATYKEYDGEFTITSDQDVARPDFRLEKITLTNSCLAEGTQVELGDGKFAAIESLQIGQQIFNPYDRKDRSLAITDTSKGIERSPMVRIHDEEGSSLLLTEMHPVATPDRGMVQARHLRAGDLVMTKRGPHKLSSVSREHYSGKVYNLKVGSKSELTNLGQDQTIIYANGFIVGDGQIQSKYEELAVKQEARTAEQVPERWRRDFQLSPHQK